MATKPKYFCMESSLERVIDFEMIALGVIKFHEKSTKIANL